MRLRERTTSDKTMKQKENCDELSEEIDMVQLCCRMSKRNSSCALKSFNDLILCIPCGKLLHKIIGCVGGNFSAGEDLFATFETGYDYFLKLYLLVVVVVAGKSDNKYPGVNFWRILKNN